MKYRVLLVEDDEAIALTVGDRLRSEGYEVDHAGDGDSAYSMGLQGAYDAIILDIMLPGRDGFAVCRDLRAHGVSTAILMLTARSEVVDRVVGLKIGGDDYLGKPFEMAELSARVEALIRRTHKSGSAGISDAFVFGEHRLDFRKQELLKDGRTVELAAQEYKLLVYLVQHRGQVLDRNNLLDAVWGYDATPTTRTVDVHIAWLRQKLGESAMPRHILTVRGRGYKFVA